MTTSELKRWVLRCGTQILIVLSMVACARQDIVQDAVLLARQGEEIKAIRLLEGYLQEHPHATRERRLLLRLYAGQGNLAAAEKQAVKLADALGQTSPVPWIELGHAWELQHRYEDALLMYDKAAAVAPQDPTGPLVGGMRAARWGELDLAAERLTEALRRDSSSADAWHALGLVEMQRGNTENARKSYESGLLAQPDSAENHLGLATLAVQQSRYEAALAHYDAIVALRPKYVGAHLGRSWMLIQLERPEAAKEALMLAQSFGADPKVVQMQQSVLAGLARKPRQNLQKPSENR